ncbi:MAG: response regulator [Desulfurivibrionaceae bacterium]
MKKHILLLESEQGMERILTLLLKQANFRVSRCRKAESVLGGTDSGTSLFGGSDLMIIDMAERGCEGSRLLRKLKAARSVPPMILITPYGNEALVERSDGPDSAIILYAPFESAELMDCIARAIDIKSD